MKLLVLHGPAIKASRIKLKELRNKFHSDNVMVFEKDEDIGIIQTNLQSISLFDGERLIIVENPPEDFILDSSLITHHSSLILWFDHQIPEKKPVMDWVKKNGQILFFPEAKEVSVFPFLDYLAAKDKRAFSEIDKLKKAGFDIHYFTTMVFYLLRNLVATPKGAKPFVREKLARQRKNFTLDKIIKLYQDVLEIDFKIKSGLLEKSQAEFLLVNKFTS